MRSLTIIRNPIGNQKRICSFSWNINRYSTGYDCRTSGCNFLHVRDNKISRSSGNIPKPEPATAFDSSVKTERAWFLKMEFVNHFSLKWKSILYFGYTYFVPEPTSSSKEGWKSQIFVSIKYTFMKYPFIFRVSKLNLKKYFIFSKFVYDIVREIFLCIRKSE